MRIIVKVVRKSSENREVLQKPSENIIPDLIKNPEVS
jgi:hypothetical protein